MADIKISELEPTTDLEGLYTIGSDKNNLSKKVSLQFLKDAANYANEQGDYAKQAGDTVNGNVGVSDYPEFSASKSYVIGDIVRYNGVLYSFTANHAASAWNGSDVKATSINAITSGKLTELEHSVEELVGHDEKSVKSTLYNSSDDSGYQSLSITIPANRTVTAILVNGAPFTTPIYIKSSDGINSDEVTPQSLPFSKNYDIAKLAAPKGLWEFIYTEPAAKGKIDEITDDSDLIMKSLKTKGYISDNDIIVKGKNSYISKCSDYIDDNGNFVTHGGYQTLTFKTESLVGISCTSGNNSNTEYAIAFYSSTECSKETFLKEYSVKFRSGVSVYNVTCIPANAKVVVISNMINTLPLEQFNINLSYDNKYFEVDSIKRNIASINSQSCLDLDLEVYKNISISREDSSIPIFAKKGTKVSINITEGSELLAGNMVPGYFEYNDGTLSSSFDITQQSITKEIEKDIVAIRFYKVREEVLESGFLHFSVNFEASPQVKTITKVVSIAKGGYLYLLDDDKIQLDLVKGDTLEVTANTDGFNRIVMYYYDGTERKTIVELNIGRTYNYYIPCNVTYIGFYADSATKDCNVEFVIRVKKANALEVPSWYTDDYLTSKENRIKSLIKAANGNVVSFAFLTDEHIDYLAGNFKSPALIKRLCDNVNIDAVINGGDISNGIELCITAFTQLMRKATRNSMYLNVVGNHEYQNENTDGDLYYHLFKNSWELVGNPSRGYYYCDNTLQKTRFIVLNAFASNGTSVIDGYESEQINWFEQEAANLPKGWNGIIFTHSLYIAPIYTDDIYYPYKLQTRGSNIVDIIKRVNNDSEKGNILFVAQGHTHNDRIISSSVTGSVPVVITASDAVYPNIDSQGRPDHNVNREVGSISEQVIDVFVVNLTENKVNIVRIGANARNGINELQGDEVEERELLL